jgi:hypothetical protein
MPPTAAVVFSAVLDVEVDVDCAKVVANNRMAKIAGFI